MSNISLDYFLAFENDLKTLARYIQFSKDNFKTYSLELVMLLLAAGSEVDVTAKCLCQKIAPTSKPKNINDYKTQSSHSDKLNQV